MAGSIAFVDGGERQASDVVVDTVVDGVEPEEGVAEALAAFRLAVRQEFERCAGVLFGHDRVIVELNDRVAAIAGRLDALEAQVAAGPQAALPSGLAPRTQELYDQALGHILEQVEQLDHRVRALGSTDAAERVSGLESRLTALEPLPAVIRALRTAVREGEQALATGLASRQADGEGSPAAPRDAAALEAVTTRLAALEERVAPLEAVPDDVAAIGRVVRRELEAVTADVQARDQVLRRALQKEIERIQGAADDREEGVRQVTQALELLERRLRGTAQTHDDAGAATTRRLEALESRLVSVDGLADDIDTLRAAARRELERLRATTQSHDQAIAEALKRFADLDGRLARLDTLPGEVQSLRSAMRVEGDRTAATLRSVEERAGEASDKAFRQLRQLADAITEAGGRIAMLDASLAVTAAQVGALTAPVVAELADPDPAADDAPPDPPPPAPARAPGG